jgi:hypothetical protein
MQPTVLIESAKGSAYLADMRRSGGIAALLGSGISIWHPSNMPNGQRITDELAKVIASRTSSDPSTVIERVRSTAFEHIMERYPKPDILRPIVAKAFYPTLPNPVHEAFAHLLDSGIIEHIITTNYDVGLETACYAVCGAGRMPQVVVTESDVATAASLTPVLFKIHGCAKPGNEDTIVLTLGGEGEMPEWKRRLLAMLVNGKHLLVCGYSGLDFEISPELARLSPSVTTWNSFQDPSVEEKALTPNARRVIDATGGTPLVGDMNKMLQALTLKTWTSDFSKGSPDFVGGLVAALEDWELDKWCVWVLNGLGYAMEGAHVARRMYRNSGASVERRSDSLLALGESLFHGGLYMQAGRAYRDAARLGRACRDWEKVVKAEVGVVESDRVAGHWLRARRRIRRLAATLPEQVPLQESDRVRSEIALKRLLLRRYSFYLSKVLRLRPLTELIRRQAKQDLQALSASFARQGSWYNLQHSEMLAGKFGIHFSEVYSGTMTPLAAREGYHHLGYVVAEMMAYRALLADPTVSDPPLNLEYIELAMKLGINPEVWKLVRAIERRFGHKVTSHTPSGIIPGALHSSQKTISFTLPPYLRRAALASWKTCEYTTLMRMLLHLRGEEV